MKLIEEINRSCKVFFTESTFFFHPSSVNRFKVTGDNTSKAINNYDNHSEEISVIKWFDDFWIYAEIRFEYSQKFISISIFQGTDNDNVKYQLFRAEWDDYNNPEEKHPQPHWHMTVHQGIEKTFEELAQIEDADTFVNLLKEEQSKMIDMKKFHFAMIGNWINGETHIHSLADNSKIVQWFQGLLSHLKIQLEYLK